MRVRGLTIRLAAALPAVLLASLAMVANAQAAGMTTHAWMAEVGIDSVRTAELREILRANPREVMSGAQFPDSGYAPGTDFGETAHWEDFTDAYAAHIRSKPECDGRLAEPEGPCAPLVAHLMGVAAHGMGDEMWDWLFEPTMADHGENPSSTARSRVDDTPGFAELGQVPGGTAIQDGAIDAEHAALDNPLGAIIGSSEYAMDVVAINDHGRTLFSPVPPPVEDVLAVYESLGQPQSAEEIMRGHLFITGALTAERLSVAEAHSVRADFPYSAAHMKTDPGGIDHTAVAVGGYYESVWSKLGGADPAPEVVQLTPAPGTTGVPVTWHPAKTQPGPYPDRGGARNRIHAVLSNSVDAATLTTETFRVVDSAGDPVPALPGFPQAGPYGSGSGTHSMLFYPASDLEPCETYTAELTTGLRNRRGIPLPTPRSWSFTTESADGSDCPRPENPAPPESGGEPDPIPNPGSGGESDPIPNTGAAAAVDELAPAVDLDVERKVGARRLLRGMKVGLGCDEACSARFELHLGDRRLAAGALPLGEGRRGVRLVPCAGAGKACERRVVRTLRRGRERLVLSVAAQDAAGNGRETAVRIRVR